MATRFDRPEIPAWRVYFDGGFRGCHGPDRAGREIPLGRRFIWDGDIFFVPAAYACKKGLVVDLCVQVPAERLRAFMEKWSLPTENNGIHLTEEQQQLIDADNPLAVRMHLKAAANGKALYCSHCSGVSWTPCVPPGGGPEAASCIRHYGLDPADGWAITRASFPWATKHKPKLKALSVTLAQLPVAVPGPHFCAPSPGERIGFTNPVTGTQHTLTVHELERQVMTQEPDVSPYQELPSHFTVMTYTLSPELPMIAFDVTDSVRSDMPRLKGPAPKRTPSSDCACAADTVIGMADGPAAIIVGGDNQNKLRAACSALRFEPADDIEWRLVFYEKKRDDITAALL